MIDMEEAITVGDLESVKLLLDNGADPNEEDFGSTCLHIVSKTKHIEIAKLLIEYGANLNTKNWYDYTPLHIASHNGYVEIKEHKHYDELIGQVNTDELTFSGDLEHLGEKKLKGKWFVGFDSAHSHNLDNPISQTFDSVKEITIKLAEELIKLGE